MVGGALTLVCRFLRALGKAEHLAVVPELAVTAVVKIDLGEEPVGTLQVDVAVLLELQPAAVLLDHVVGHRRLDVKARQGGEKIGCPLQFGKGLRVAQVLVILGGSNRGWRAGGAGGARRGAGGTTARPGSAAHHSGHPAMKRKVAPSSSVLLLVEGRPASLGSQAAAGGILTSWAISRRPAALCSSRRTSSGASSDAVLRWIPMRSTISGSGCTQNWRSALRAPR